MAAIEGVITAMVTPFDDGRRRRPRRRPRARRRLVEHGSHGLVVAGTTGESPTLSDEEKLGCCEAVKDEVGDAGDRDLRHRHERHRATRSS